jgi:hypothetical protein
MQPTRTLTQRLDFLSAVETLFFRRLSRASGLLLLMLRLCRPLTAQQASEILNQHYRTTLGYFRTLQDLGLVCRDDSGRSFRLSDGLLDPVGPQETVESCQNLGFSTFFAACANFSRSYYLLVNCDLLNTESESLTNNKQENIRREQDTAPLFDHKENPEVVEALRQAGILNP